MTATMQQRYLLQALLMLACSSVAFACHGQLVAGLSEGEKEIILHEHNKLRQLVANGRYPGQPGAANMREIVWDDELAVRAQKWADNCQFRHDPHRTIIGTRKSRRTHLRYPKRRPNDRFTMGQNLAIIWSTAPLDPTDGDFPSRIQSWFNEVQKYSFGDAWSPKTGHYSQLVWGETSLVGCGFAEYKDTSKYNKLYVCNYGPGGNVVGFNPYAVGKPSCGSYGLRSSASYQGLCAPSSAPVVGIAANTIDTYEYKQTNTKHTAYSSTQPAPSPKQASSFAAPQAAAAASSAYAAQAGHAYRYKNKFEAYKPSSAEFQKSVLKHTILRTYIGATAQSQNSNYNHNQYQNQYQQHQQQQTQQQEQEQEQEQAQAAISDDPVPEIYVYDESNANTTPAPAKRGWSLLSWRG